MPRPPRIGRRQAGLPRRSSGQPRQPPMPPPDAACLCEGTRTGLRAAIHVGGDHRDQLIAQFWAAHTGGTHTPVGRLPDVRGKGDPK
jgi:hypothetical protein